MKSRLSTASASFILTLMLTLAALTSGCHVANRRPLQVSALKMSFVPSQQKLCVRVDNTLPGSDINVTVWDNVVGPFADAGEARKIGYTQNYNKVVLAGVAGGPVVAGVAGPMLVESRIVIPFGPIFTKTLQSGIPQAFPNARMLTNSIHDGEVRADEKYQVAIRVEEFRVWEAPLNHINLSTKVICSLQETGELSGTASTFEVQRQATGQKIGSVFSTSGGFIHKMNGIANTFAGDVVTEVLDTLQKRTAP